MDLRRTRVPALLLAVGLGLMACSSASDEAMSDTAAGAAPEAAEAPAETPDRALRDGTTALDMDESADLAYSGSTESSQAGSSANRAGAIEDPGIAPMVIQVGTMTVQSEDVAEARIGLEKVVDAYAGTIADEKTMASSEGEVQTSKVVMRIPSADFDEAMIDLAKLGEVVDSTRKAQDVTGEVIDTQARIRAQEQSLERVEVLFARAQNIRDIVAIEAQLSRRQAELDSLKGQLAYLRDQTSLSTITAYLEQTPEEPKPATKPAENDDNAFVGGLKDGWDALSTLGSGLATVSGALLPFALVALFLGLPASIVVRRWLASHPVRRPAPEG